MNPRVFYAICIAAIHSLIAVWLYHDGHDFMSWAIREAPDTAVPVTVGGVLFIASVASFVLGIAFMATLPRRDTDQGPVPQDVFEWKVWDRIRSHALEEMGLDDKEAHRMADREVLRRRDLVNTIMHEPEDEPICDL